MNGTVLNIQRFCTSDGPGIRTTVFLKGCPLRCLWCHNPESQIRKSEVLFDAEKCVNCLSCASPCPVGAHTLQDGQHVYDRTHCLACGKCISPLCSALELSGREMTVEEVLAEVRKDLDFYKSSNGGMTISGGEPFHQSAFTEALLKAARSEGIHTALETCGYAPTEAVLRVSEYVDLFLFDYKETDPILHKEFTGVDHTQILENLRAIDERGKETVLRCPIIPGLNDRPDHLYGIATLANRLKNVREIEVEPYHTLGEGKYPRLGRAYALPDVSAPSAKTADGWIAEIARHTSVCVKKA